MSNNCKNYFDGDALHIGGKVIFEEGAEIEGLPSAEVENLTVDEAFVENQPESTATSLQELVKDFNLLLDKLKSAGIMKADDI